MKRQTINRKQDIHLYILYDSIFSLAVKTVNYFWYDHYFFAYTLKMFYCSLSEDKQTTHTYILIRKCFVILSNLLHQAKKEGNTFYLHTKKKHWKRFYFINGWALGPFYFRIICKSFYTNLEKIFYFSIYGNYVNNTIHIFETVLIWYSYMPKHC